VLPARFYEYLALIPLLLKLLAALYHRKIASLVFGFEPNAPI